MEYSNCLWARHARDVLSRTWRRLRQCIHWRQYIVRFSFFLDGSFGDSTLCCRYQKASFPQEFLSFAAGMILAEGDANAGCAWRIVETVNPAEGGGHEG